MKEKINNLFAGRNGLDMWNYIIVAVDVVLIAVSMLTNSYLPLAGSSRMPPRPSSASTN